MGHYVYYSFEEGGGRGYIGVRHKDPGGDEGYLGSFHDPTFKPSRKIIIRKYDTAEGAIRGEIALHALFNVGAASHFANRANQTHRGFSTYGVPKTEAQKKAHSERMSGGKNPNYGNTGSLSAVSRAIIAIKPDGTKLHFGSICEAERKLKTGRNSLTNFLKPGILPKWGKFKGWQFQYV